MKNAVEMKIGGLKCDNPKCNYINMNIKVEEYEQWLNKPCPNCGQNLLTYEDYRNTLFLMKMFEVANEIYPKREDDENTSIMTVKMDGSGDIEIDIN